MFYLTSRILHLEAHCVNLPAKMHQLYSLKMTLYGLKNVEVMYSVNKVVF